MKTRVCSWCGNEVELKSACPQCQKEAEKIIQGASNLLYDERLTLLRKYCYNRKVEIEWDTIKEVLDTLMGRELYLHEMVHPERLLLELESKKPKTDAEVIMGVMLEYGDKVRVVPLDEQ